MAAELTSLGADVCLFDTLVTYRGTSRHAEPRSRAPVLLLLIPDP